MALSEKLASVEPWLFRTPFADSWISDSFARDTETETLTKALEKSLSSSAALDLVAPYPDLIVSGTPPTPTASNVSGSDLESPAPKRQRNAIPVSGGKVSKRKSRATKRSQTTYITADPANFRQMVQQVTGVRFGNAQLQVAPVLKPEAQRPGSRLTGAGAAGFLPTLDTSAFLLEHHQHQQNVSMGPAVSGVGFGPGPLEFQSSMVSEGGSAGLDFETFQSFPTLESWK